MSIFNSDLPFGKILPIVKDVEKSVHFVGILGAGMYPLATLLRRRGHRITGSDINAREDVYTDQNGIVIKRPCGVFTADMLVYSLAIGEDDPEIAYAVERGIPMISRAQLLGALMSEYRIRVSVSGSHGKSTTTALIDHILTSSWIGHTTLSGASLTSGAALYDGGGDIFVAEACEYKDSFLRLCPTHQIITSVELDHTDYFKSEEMLRLSFLKAAKMADVTLVNADDSVAASVADQMRQNYTNEQIYTYGRSEEADYRFTGGVRENGITEFTVKSRGRGYTLKTSLIGEFNLYNITAAVAMADILGVSVADIENAVSTFTRIDRRMSLLSKPGDVPIYYDYAHHPTEIGAVITALKQMHGTLTVIFRPHTYTRTKSLWNDFIKELSKADFTIILDIYPAREKYIEGVDSEALAKEIECGIYSEMSRAAKLALGRGSGAIALLGAGDVESVKDDLVRLSKTKGDIPDRR